MERVSFRRLRYFLAVAEELHFGRAAKRLGIAQPPLSQQIQRLETAVGYPLFHRKPRVALTAAGRVLVGVAREALEQVDTGIKAARRAAIGKTGRVRVGFDSSVMLTHLPQVVRNYRERFPDVDLQLRQMSTSAQSEALRAGRIDLGFLRQPKVGGELKVEIITHEPFVAVLPPGHHLESKPAIALQDLADDWFVHFPRDLAPQVFDQVSALCREAGFEPQIIQWASEWLTIVALVEAGVGVSVVPASFHKLQWGIATYVPLTGASVETTVALCWQRPELPPVAQRFVEVALEHTSQLDGGSRRGEPGIS